MNQEIQNHRQNYLTKRISYYQKNGYGTGVANIYAYNDYELLCKKMIDKANNTKLTEHYAKCFESYFEGVTQND